MTPGLPDSARDAEASTKEKRVGCLCVSSFAPLPTPRPMAHPRLQESFSGSLCWARGSRRTYGADFLGTEELLKQPPRPKGSTWGDEPTSGGLRPVDKCWESTSGKSRSTVLRTEMQAHSDPYEGSLSFCGPGFRSRRSQMTGVRRALSRQQAAGPAVGRMSILD